MKRPGNPVYDTREPFPPGTILISKEARYELCGLAGRGGSALIYRAEKIRDGKTASVMLKEVYPFSDGGGFWRDENGRVTAEGKNQELLETLYQRFQKEAETGRRLRAGAFLVCGMEILEEAHLEGKMCRLPGWAEMEDLDPMGKLLNDRVEELTEQYGKAIPAETSIRLLCRIAETMEKIHSVGYLYCDFSPRNVFLLKEDTAAVFIDFGSALEKLLDGTVVTDQYIPASWGFRAPEVVESGKRELKESCDVYAILTLFYQLISGNEFAVDGYEFSKAIYKRDRQISGSRLGKIGIGNPAAGLILNQIIQDGLTYSGKERLPDIHSLLDRMDLLVRALKEGTDLLGGLKFLYRNGIKADGALSSWFAGLHPSRAALYDAISSLDQELLADYDPGEVDFLFFWLRQWYENDCGEPLEGKKASKRKKTAGKTGFSEAKRKKMQMAYCGVAVYNHMGQPEAAIRCYNVCEALRDGMELRKYLAVRLRVAESYADLFDFPRALEIVETNERLLKQQKECFKDMAREFGITSMDTSRTVELGKTESALGRYHAFLGNWKKARKYFDLSIRELKNEDRNKERTRNSSFVMASVSGDLGLFEDCRKACLSRYLDARTVSGQLAALLYRLAEPGRGSRQDAYYLDALLKGVRVFGRRCFATGEEDSFYRELWRLVPAAPGTLPYTTDQLGLKKGHPWELIYRSAAILIAEQAPAAMETLFCASLSAVTPKNDAEGLDTIRVLSMVTKIYRAELCLRITEGNGNRKVEQEQALKECMEELRGYLSDHGCTLLEEDAWERCGTVLEQYQYVVDRFTFEYF